MNIEELRKMYKDNPRSNDSYFFFFESEKDICIGVQTVELLLTYEGISKVFKRRDEACFFAFLRIHSLLKKGGEISHIKSTCDLVMVTLEALNYNRLYEIQYI